MNKWTAIEIALLTVFFVVAIAFAVATHTG